MKTERVNRSVVGKAADKTVGVAALLFVIFLAVAALALFGLFVWTVVVVAADHWHLIVGALIAVAVLVVLAKIRRGD